ncbi:hypothetical protein BG842_25775 [Haladaptatus sp. W1]|uniref:hypothetical protein n=1 Tax=Haladaptatus sp. W1 TaxID=1897478 RepID=UPI000849870D|nr:hypothetical protein [Haladaptatus sp. W1]ODR83329.1 hypothetical protein BG842_25775 [Haladaptatus sp. W1]
METDDNAPVEQTIEGYDILAEKADDLDRTASPWGRAIFSDTIRGPQREPYFRNFPVAGCCSRGVAAAITFRGSTKTARPLPAWT